MIYRRPNDPPPHVAMYYTPRWRVHPDPPRAGMLHVPSVPTLVYTVAKNTARRARCEQWMSWAGFTTWCFGFGTPSVPHHRTIPADHARLLIRNDPPLLILEDDAEPAEWRSNLVVPPGADVLYLGGFRTAPAGWQDDANRRGFTIASPRGYGYIDHSPDWFRCAGLWGCHAMLWLSKATMLEAAAALMRSPRNVDDTYAQCQARWNAYCLKSPLLWQNDGHHLWETLRYWPPSASRRNKH